MSKRPFGRLVVCQTCGKPYKRRNRKSKYCSQPCQWAVTAGKNRTPGLHWRRNAAGYIHGYVRVGGKKRYIKQHRYFVEQAIGRPLKGDETVHHINGKRDDNRMENLEIMLSPAHSRHHAARRREAKAVEARALLREMERASDAQRQETP